VNLVCVAGSLLNPAWPRVEQCAGALMASFMAAAVLAPLILYLYRSRVLRPMARPARAPRRTRPHDRRRRQGDGSAGGPRRHGPAAITNAFRTSDCGTFGLMTIPIESE